MSKARATRRLRRQCDEHEGIQGQTALSGRVNCDRNVIRRAQDLKKHRRLRTHTELLSWKVKSLISCALSHVGVRWCRWPASLSKRAPSTTRTSLLVSGINSVPDGGERTYGSVRNQLIHVYVPNWTGTTFPSRLAAERRTELSRS